jgi:hypothetical protein
MFEEEGEKGQQLEQLNKIGDGSVAVTWYPNNDRNIGIWKRRPLVMHLFITATFNEN